MECMDMEDGGNSAAGNINNSSSNTNGQNSSLPSIHLWYLHDGKGIKTTTLEEVDLKEISVRSLKEIAVHDKPEESFTTSVNEIDILHNGVVLQEKEGVSLEAMNIKPNSILHVIKKLGSHSAQTEEAFKEFKNESRQAVSNDSISELVLALKTMTLSPKFLTTIEKLSEPQTLKNVIAVVPNLQFDPIGISIIQDVSMIFYLANEESLRALAETRPWVVEAFNFIAAGIHQQEASSSRDGASGRMPSGLSSAFLSYVRQQQEEEDEEDEASPAEGVGAQQQQITRQQLVAALNSLSGFGLFPGGQPPQQQQQGANSSSRTVPPPLSAAQRQSSTSRLTDPLSLLLPGVGASRPRSEPTSGFTSQPATPTPPPPVLTGELVARAMRDALSQLPPEQRTAQMNAFRSLALSLNQQPPPQRPSNPLIPPVPIPTTNNQTPMTVDNPTATIPAPAAAAASQYQEELAQMRDLGIHDDNLSLTALQECDGDVAQAVELIFSGYYTQQ